MKKVIIVLVLLMNFSVFAQEITTIYVSDINITHKSETSFSEGFLTYTTVIMGPSRERKTLDAGLPTFMISDENQNQVKIGLGFIFGQTKKGNYQARIASLANYLSTNPEKAYKIELENEELKRIVPVKAERITMTSSVNDPLGFDKLFDAAQSNYRDSNYEEALIWINKSLKIEPINIDAIYLKCYIFIQQKDYANLIETASIGIDEYPNDARFYDIRGSSYYFDSQPELALKDYRKMLKLNKTDARYYNNYLQLLSEQQMDEETKAVFKAFEKAEKSPIGISNDTYIPEVYFYQAEALSRYNESSEAIAMLTKAINLSDTSGKYFNSRGLLYEQKKIFESALADFKMAISLEPKNAKYIINRADVYYSTNQFDLSRKDLQRALSIDGGSLRIYSGLGNIYLQQNNPKLAIENFNNALKESPNNTNIIGNSGYAYWEIGENDRAIKMWEKVAYLQSEDIDLLVGLAVGYKQQGNQKRFSETIQQIKDKTSYEPNKGLLKQLMKTTYYYTPKFQKAWETTVE